MFCFDSYNQSISGIVNSYTEVTSVSNNSVNVVSTFGFMEGDKVLLIQMKGATITTGNISDFGVITSLNNAGNFEFGIIESIAGPLITLETDLCESYEISGLVQLVKVPVYTDVTISGVLTAQPWNGTRGGVLAIEATGSISFDSYIDVSGQGFLGGQVYTGFFGCGDSNWANTNAGEKGEGIADAPVGEEGNRAPLANGGGGSNTGNPGAGGGGNGGAGGRGGNEFYGWCGLNVSYGLGGYDMDYTGYRAFFGGGGGGGYRDNNLNATDGANGGGIAFLISPLIHGNGTQSRDFTYIDNVIQANELAATTENLSAVNQVFNVAFGESTTLNELVPLLRDLLGKFDPKINDVQIEYGDERVGDIRHSLASVEKANSLLGYTPAFNLSRGLHEAIDWYWNDLK